MGLASEMLSTSVRVGGPDARGTGAPSARGIRMARSQNRGNIIEGKILLQVKGACWKEPACYTIKESGGRKVGGFLESIFQLKGEDLLYTKRPTRDKRIRSILKPKGSDISRFTKL